MTTNRTCRYGPCVNPPSPSVESVDHDEGFCSVRHIILHDHIGSRCSN